MSDDTLLEINDLCISYFTRASEIPAVENFDLRLQAGQSIGLVGESGCGKSTVALAIMGYMGRNGAITKGSIMFNGRELTALSAEELRHVRGSEITMVYQEPMAALNPSMTIANQLMEVPISHEGIGQPEAQKRCLEMLDRVHLPDPIRVMRAYPHQISGGQQQRVVIAMALLSRPKLLLLDEPTTALDVTVEAGIIALIGEISREFGTSMIYISHNLGLIRETCDSVCVMYSGEVIEQGSIDKIVTGPRHPYTKGLFDCIALPTKGRFERPLVPIRGQLPLPHRRPPGCNFGPRCDFFVAGQCDVERNILMTPEADDHTHRVRCHRVAEIDWTDHQPEMPIYKPKPFGSAVLKANDLKKYYILSDPSFMGFLTGRSDRVVKANETMSFTAHNGETLAIVGESGCGKSTLAKVLVGLETATSGSLILNDEEISDKPVEKRTPEQIRGLQMIFQNPFDTLNPSHTIGAQIIRVIRQFGVAQDIQGAKEIMLKLLDTVKLPRDFAKRKPHQLSGGQKQRVSIARAFAGNPSTVIADEPVSALDVSVAAAVTQLLLEIQHQHDTTLLFISHDLGIVRYLADRVIVMYLGQIMEHGTTEEIFNPPYHPYTEALLSAVPVADVNVEKRRIILEGALPSALNPPPGCPFASRCPRKQGQICETDPPPLQINDSGHKIACHIPIADLSEIEPVFKVVA